MAKFTAHQCYGSAVGDAFGEIIRGIDALANVAIRNKLFGLTSPRPGGSHASSSVSNLT